MFHRHPARGYPYPVEFERWMMTIDLDAILDAIESRPMPHKDVAVALNAGTEDARAQLAADRADLNARFEGAREAAAGRLSAPAPELSDYADEFVQLEERSLVLDRAEAEFLVTFRFWQLPGTDWADLTVKHQNGFGGYDLNTVARAAAEINGAIVDDGTVTPVTGEQWTRLWAQFSGRAVDEIAAAVFNLNVADPAGEVERLGKVSRPLPVTDSD